MGDDHRPIPAGGVSVMLLDSAQGQPIQTWRFTNQAEISIGREDGNDIVISDPHVSRRHVRIVAMEGTWMLFSQGRHGTIIDDRLVAEKELYSGTVFRLGPAGPMLRFDRGKLSTNASQTMDQISPDMLDQLKIDEQRMQQEVDQIAAGALFDELLQESQRLRSTRHGGREPG
jgi:pSer/pThr/pTyr-binding forkhead associated (FHA) protein